MPALPALTVDIAGLAKLVERRGKSFAILEVIQNAWDEDVSTVTVTLQPAGRGRSRLVVTDDSPEGFRDLSHAFTMFADSYKKDNAEKRGRFNLGEKLVIALSDEVEIVSTKGGVSIDVRKNERRMLRRRHERGTSFQATVRMNEAEREEAIRVFHTLIPPHGVVTTLNGEVLLERELVHSFEAKLRTEIADADGFLRPTTRTTTVEVYDPEPCESGTIYEMGIPVVTTGDRWHVNVLQKVPLNTDRDNVTPGYLRDLRALTLNAMASALDKEDAAASWVTDALEDEVVEEAAVLAVMTRRFGEKRVSYDPSDPEANKLAASRGYTVVPGGSLSGDAWSNVKRFSAIKPAGQVTPSPKPYSENGDPLNVIPEDQWSEGMRNIAAFAQMVAREVLGASTSVRMANEFSWPYVATYGRGGGLTFNVTRLGRKWFDGAIRQDVIDLIIHEFGHHYESDHLSSGYYRALTKIGAGLTRLALDRPDLFAPFERKAV